MAVTKIKQIYSTEAKAIAYIINAEKTENGRFAEYFLCGTTAAEAAEFFSKTRRFGSGRSKILAQHIMQSFAANETTPEQAREVGLKLAGQLLKGEYQYVLATHVDKEHIHNHLIFCNTNLFNYKTFETNENRGKVSWKKLRNLSDELCREQSLSVIGQSELSEKGQGYYEFTQSASGGSWKQKIKNIVNACVNESENFDDFRRRMSAATGAPLAVVEVVYRPENKIKLKFRLEGQKKFTRARTLGKPYDVDGITERIERNLKFLSGENIRKPRIRIISPGAENEHLERWIRLKNMKTAAEVLFDLERRHGAVNFGELKEKITLKTASRKSLILARNKIKSELAEYTLIAQNADIYRANKVVYKEYKAQDVQTAERFAQENAARLAAFGSAGEFLSAYKFEGNKLPDSAKITARLQYLAERITAYESEIKAVTTEIGELSAYEKALRKYPGRDEADVTERENNERARDGRGNDLQDVFR